MSNDTETDHQNLSIRCPTCRQRFSVDLALMGKMVECGGCDTRFRINDDVIVRSKKFYPGERGGPALNRFQRVPLSSAAPDGLQTMRYAEFNHPERLGPVAPQRVIAGVFGVVLMAITALLLIFAVGPGGSFNGMTLPSKLVIACFVSLLGIVLLLYANPNARLKAGVVALLLAAGVICLPFFFEGTPVISKRGIEPMAGNSEPLFPEDEINPMEELKIRFGTKPVEEERQRLEEAGSKNYAYGVYLTDIAQRNIYTARDYLIRETAASEASHRYPRDNGDYLVLLTGVEANIDVLAEIARKLGAVTEMHPEIGILVVKVDNNQVLAGAAEKLNDKNDPAFYELNRRELFSIDLDRAKSAVERLRTAEPTIYRTDISRRMVELLTKPGVRFQDNIASALLIWGEEPGPAGNAALEAIKTDMSNDVTIPESLVKLVVKEGIAEAIPTINELWIKNPTLWAKHYAKFGPAIEDVVFEQINTEDALLRRSVLSILAKVGTQKSLPVLRVLLNDENPDVRVLSERAVEAISSR
jgi:hypothetical protein